MKIQKKAKILRKKKSKRSREAGTASATDDTDVRSWKIILVQWVTQCGFTDCNFFNLDQSDIDLFYKNFCKHLKSAKTRKSLIAFLEENYPEFQWTLDDEKLLSTGEYVYAYSLLLHFCCVKYPHPYFHDICQKLTGRSQQCIATFFKQLLEVKNLNKENLRQAIAIVTNADKASPPGGKAANNSFGSSHSSSSGVSVPSPSRRSPPSDASSPAQPKHSTRTSPSTPRTFMLEERTRELYNLRAMLETERYEKGILELQCKQNEEKIAKLNQDHKKLQQQIQDLKNDIAQKSGECPTTSDGNNDQIKKSLHKEVAQKETEISKLTGVLSLLKEEKCEIQEKLSYAERQVVMCVDQVKELEFKLDELSGELESRDETIKYLTENQKELERFISETRSASSNMSVECLDTSASPETLATTVVDIQLHEKTNENYRLRDELSAVRTCNARLARHIQKLAYKHSQEFDVKIENVPQSEDELADPTEHFMVYAKCMDKVVLAYRDERQKNSQLKSELDAVLEKNAQLTKQVEKLNEEAGDLRGRINSAEKEKNELENLKKDLKEALMQCAEEVDALSKEKCNLVQKMEQLTTDYDECKNSLETKQTLWETEVKELKEKLESENSINREISESNSKLKLETEKLEKDLQELQNKLEAHLEEHEAAVSLLNDKVQSHKFDLEAQQKSQQMVKEKYEHLLIQYEDMKRGARDADEYLESMRAQIVAKEQDMIKLGVEIVELRTKNVALEARINQVMMDFRNEKHNSEVSINKREMKIKEVETERDRLKTLLEQTQESLTSTQNQMQLSKNELEIIAQKLRSINFLLEIIQTDGENDIPNNLENIKTRVKALIEYRATTEDKIEKLEVERQDKSAVVRAIEEQLQRELHEKEVLVEDYKKQIDDTKSGLEEAQQKIDEYEDFIDELKEKMDKELLLKEEELANLLHRACGTHEDTIKQLQADLKAEREALANKSVELETMTKDYSNLQKKFESVELQYKHMQEWNASFEKDNVEKIKQFQTKIENCTAENLKLLEEINMFKEDQALIEGRLAEADSLINDLSEQLEGERTEKNELISKLKESESRVQDIQMKLETVSSEKTKTVDELQGLYESLKSQLNLVEKEMAQLESTKTTQAETITNLKQKLRKANEEKENAVKQWDEIVVKLDCTQGEKAAILKSLEKTADQLSKSVEEKAKQQVVMENHCSDLQKRFDEAVEKNDNLQKRFDEMIEKNTHLKNELTARQTEIRRLKEEQQMGYELWQSNITELKDMLGKRSEELEAIDLELIAIIAVLENNTNLTMQLETDKIVNHFNANEKESDSNLNQLKRSLNMMLAQLKKSELERKDSDSYVQVLSDDNVELTKTIDRQKDEIDELRNSIQNELIVEVQRLRGELEKLDENNQKLTGENARLQMKLVSSDEEKRNIRLTIDLLKNEKEKILEDQKFNNELVHNMKVEESKLKDSVKEKMAMLEKQHWKNQQLEKQLRDKTTKYTDIEKELQSATDAIKEKQNEMQELHMKLANLKQELAEEKQMYDAQTSVLTHTQGEAADLKKELSIAQAKVLELTHKRTQLEEHLKTTTTRLDESMSKQLDYEKKYQKLIEQYEDMQQDYSYYKAQHQKMVIKMDNMMTEIEKLKREKEHLQDEKKKLQDEEEKVQDEKEKLQDELKDTKQALQRSTDNISQLIQQISAGQMEKDELSSENQQLRLQIEDFIKNINTSDTKVQEVLKNSIMLEEKLSADEKELQAIRAILDNAEANAEKLVKENKKLRESKQDIDKRLEKVSVQLGDSQGSCSKLERENDKLTKTIEEKNTAVASLQRENDKLTKTIEEKNTAVASLQREKEALQNDNKSLQELLQKAKQAQEQFTIKVQQLEQTNAALETAKKALESCENELKSKLNKLDKRREDAEEKIRKLNDSLHIAEKTSVNLNLEIGGLNSEIVRFKKTAESERKAQLEAFNKQLKQADDQVQRFKEQNDKLKAELVEQQEKTNKINDQLTKVSVSLQNSNKKHEAHTKEMDKLKAEMLKLKEEKTKLERELAISGAKLKECEMQTEKLLEDKRELVMALESNVTKLETELAGRTADSKRMGAENEALRDEIAAMRAAAQKSTADKGIETEPQKNPLAEELEMLRTRFSVVEERFYKEQDISTQLRLDNQILQAKYREAKQRLEEEYAAAEERIKENRLELEGKLEKMKQKMKSLYTEETAKLKSKQERETGQLKSEMVVLQKQNQKLEAHTKKLSNEILRLNDFLMEEKKQNTILATKINHLSGSQKDFKHPGCSQSSTTAAASSLPAPSNLGNNMAMEDEEGEVFNNTYLTDLKTGRMSALMGQDVCTEELQYRNSLCPPHLKSTYAAQYGHGLAEEEIRDGPQSFDDSMCTLLSTTTGGGARKKIPGCTLYKRPGPPTPSKHGGRLSFGGNTEPPREILKECADNNAVSSSSKTPARFSFFGSRFSMGNSEPSDGANLYRLVQQKNLELARLADAAVIGVCTSTPRKSRSHEHRQLLAHIIKGLSPASPLAVEIQEQFVESLENPLNGQQRQIASTDLATFHRRRSSLQKRRTSRRYRKLIPVRLTEETPSSAQTSSPGHSPSKPSNACRRLRRQRSSLYLRGDIYSRHRMPNRTTQRALSRRTARRQRNENFNRHRFVETLQAEVDNCEKDCPPEKFCYLYEDDDDFELLCDEDYDLECQLQNGDLGDADDGCFKTTTINQQQLVGSQELRHFDEADAWLQGNANLEDAAAGDCAAGCSSQRFEQLLAEKASSAPFDVDHLQFEGRSRLCSTSSSTHTRTHTQISDSLPSHLSLAQASCSTAISTATPHPSPIGSVQLSRTIYGGSIIYNRRIPNINLTNVRKSSIYIKNTAPDASAPEDVILVTNQTITLTDLMRMWAQMDTPARMLVGFALMASLISLYILAIRICESIL